MLSFMGIDPFAAAPPHLKYPGKGQVAWITDPPGMLNVLDAGVVLDFDRARFIFEQVEAAMKKRWPHARRFHYIHDFSRIANYDAKARSAMMEWAGQRKQEVEHVILIAPPMNAVVRMGVRTAIALLHFGGMKIELADSLADALAKLPLRPAA